jgi:protein polybromo-1
MVERGDEKGDDIIGRRIAVWWPTEELFYLGNVEAYNVANGDHSIRYDDGQLEDVALCMQRVKWLDMDVLLPSIDEEAEEEKAAPRLHVRPPGVAGAEEATVRVPLGGFSVYTRLKPSTVTMKNSERRKCFEILQAVRKVEDDGRSLSEPFERLPSRFALPEYYEIIKCPVDCVAIERMLRKPMAGYPNVWFFLVAMELMFTNCQRFNDPASTLYRDAEVLRGVYLQAVQERFPGHPVPSKNIYDNVDEPAWDKPADNGVIEDEDDPFPQKYVQPEFKQSNAQATQHRKRRARDDSDSEEYIPKRRSQRSAPRDRRVPKSPIDCAIYILSRVHGNAMPLNSLYKIMADKGVDGLSGRRPLAALGALLRQNPLVFRDARGGEVWELVNKVDVDTDEEIDYVADNGEDEMSEDAYDTLPTEKMEMTKQEASACRSVLAAIRACKDKKGRKRAEPFELLPTRKALPQYYRAISAPIDLGSIQKCLNTGGYPSTWMFCVALELMLSNCQNFNESSSTLYKDAEVLRGVIAKTIQSLYPGHPVPARDSPYDAAKCVEPRWRPHENKTTPKIRFTMNPVPK